MEDQTGLIAVMFVALFPLPLAVVAAFIALVDAPAEDVACSFIVVVEANVTIQEIGSTVPLPLAEGWYNGLEP